MGMNNPHNPEGALWDAYMSWTSKWKADPHNSDAKSNSDYYFDQWMKQTEKRVLAELRDKKIKDTAADKLKMKPRAGIQ